MLRRDAASDRDRVTFVELFFDLVFVLAVTQFSEILDAAPTLEGVAQTAVAVGAVWWVWVYTVWATNWLDPRTQPVLWFLLLLMLFGLVLSEAIPKAFTSAGALFVASYLIFGVIRTSAILLATARHQPAVAAGQRRIFVWYAAAAPFWIAGVFTSGTTRLLLWALGLLIEYLGPATLFWLPRRGRSSWDAWRISGAHFAERCALFVLIALGESIVVTGGTLGRANLTMEVGWSFAVSFITTVLLWLLYFAHGEAGGTTFIKRADETGPVARISYTYLHVVLILGIVLTTHGYATVLDDPSAAPTIATIAFVTLGPALYLGGNVAFKRSVGSPALPGHLGGMAAYLVLFAVGAAGLIGAGALGLAWIATAILIVVVVVDERLWRIRNRGVAIDEDV